MALLEELYGREYFKDKEEDKEVEDKETEKDKEAEEAEEEEEVEEEAEKKPEEKPKRSILTFFFTGKLAKYSFIFLIIYILLTIYALYLSTKCNTTAFNLFDSLFALFLGPVYVVHKSRTCFSSKSQYNLIAPGYFLKYNKINNLIIINYFVITYFVIFLNRIYWC